MEFFPTRRFLVCQRAAPPSVARPGIRLRPATSRRPQSIGGNLLLSTGFETSQLSVTVIEPPLGLTFTIVSPLLRVCSNTVSPCVTPVTRAASFREIFSVNG